MLCVKKEMEIQTQTLQSMQRGENIKVPIRIPVICSQGGMEPPLVKEVAGVSRKGAPGAGLPVTQSGAVFALPTVQMGRDDGS